MAAFINQFPERVPLHISFYEPTVKLHVFCLRYLMVYNPTKAPVTEKVPLEPKFYWTA